MDSIVNNTQNYKDLALELALLFEQHKAEKTVVLEVETFCSFADFFIITNARSSRHLFSLVMLTKDFFLGRNMPVFYPAKDDPGGWAILDGGPIIVHIMEELKRNFYELEKIWFQSKIIYSSKSS